MKKVSAPPDAPGTTDGFLDTPGSPYKVVTDGIQPVPGVRTTTQRRGVGWDVRVEVGGG